MITNPLSMGLSTRAMRYRVTTILSLVILVTIGSLKVIADSGNCGGSTVTLPFADVASSNIFFCSIAEAYFSGLTNGTSQTTYNPSDPVPRDQMAAFVSRTLDQAVKRSNKRAALQQFWTTKTQNNLGLTTVGPNPMLVQSDGADLWVAIDTGGAGVVSRIRGSDGKLLETWTGAQRAFGVLCAMGKVFVTGQTAPGKLYQIDPTQPAGPVTILSSGLGDNPQGIGFDGQRIWIANFGGEFFVGSVSIVTLNPVTVTTITNGFSLPSGITYDGSNIWLADYGDEALKKLDSNGNVLLSVNVGGAPLFPAFDGTNIWVPTIQGTVSVVRATGALSGTVLATLTGNGLTESIDAAFDGERVLVTNDIGPDNMARLSLWRASDLVPLGSTPINFDRPFGACSDGVSFWIAIGGSTSKLARF